MNDYDVYEKAEEEGLGYFVLHYTDGSKIFSIISRPPTSMRT